MYIGHFAVHIYIDWDQTKFAAANCTQVKRLVIVAFTDFSDVF